MLFKSMATEKTSTPETTKEKMIYLFDKSNKYIWVSSGFNTEFYTDPQVMSAMTNAFKRIGEIKILIEGDIAKRMGSLKWLFAFKEQFGNKLQIRCAVDVPHWLIVDGKHFRLEKEHATGSIGNNNLFVTDVEQPLVSDVIERRFEDWWFRASSIE